MVSEDFLPSACLSGYLILFDSLTVLSATNIWAFGVFENPNHVLIEHWDGIAWSVVSTPSLLSNDGYIDTVGDSYSTSDGNIWVYMMNVGGDVFLLKTDGNTWSEVPSVGWDQMTCSGNNVWLTNRSSWTESPLFYYDGSSWHSVPSDQTPGWWMGSAVISDTDVWTIGEVQNQPIASKHWDGIQLTTVSMPSLQGMNTQSLQSISAVNTNDIWAIGGAVDGKGNTHPLIEHYVSTPAPTVTNASFTGTEGQTGTGIVPAQSASNSKITLTATGLPSFASFKDNGNGAGTVSYSPKAGNAGTYTFRVIASDGSQTGTGTVTLTIAKAPTQNKLFVFVQGINTELDSSSLNNGYGYVPDFFDKGTVGDFLKNNGFNGARYVYYTLSSVTIHWDSIPVTENLIHMGAETRSLTLLSLMLLNFHYRLQQRCKIIPTRTFISLPTV